MLTTLSSTTIALGSYWFPLAVCSRPRVMANRIAKFGDFVEKTGRHRQISTRLRQTSIADLLHQALAFA